MKPSTIISHYEVLERADPGGIGEVYAARDSRLERDVLLKFLPEPSGADSKARASFRSAIASSASLTHPNIARVLDLGDSGGRPFAVFETLHGSPLRTAFKDTYPTLGQTLDIVRQVCMALQHAHQAGVTHGAISPDCIWVAGSGWVQVIDFALGIARDALDGDAQSQNIAVEYGAPELQEGYPPDELTDIYSAGLILYELVAGVHPFRRASVEETRLAIVSDKLQPIGKYQPGLPDSLERIIDRSLDRDRRLRYQSISDMLTDISIEISGRVMLESEARYRSLNDDVLDSSWVGTCILDRESRVVWINRALERYLCLRREDAIGEDWQTLLDTKVKQLIEGGEDFVERVRTALKDNSYIERFECHLLPSNQCQERWLEHWSQPIRSGVYAGGRIEHYSDVSDRIQALRALKESEDKYRSLVVNAADGIAILQDRRITFANPSLAAMLSRPVTELVGSLFADFMHPDDAGHCEAAYDRQMASRDAVQQIEVILMTASKTQLDAEVSVASITVQQAPAVLVVLRDVTARKRSERLLRLEQERAQRYLNIAATMIVAIDADGCVGLINRKGCEVLGVSETEIVGRNWFDLFLPESIREDVKTVFGQLMDGKFENVEYYENPVVNADGEERLIAWHNSLIKDDNGRIVGSLSSGTDVTERRQVEDAYRDTAATLQSVFLAAPVGIGLVNDRRFGWVNDRLCQMTGYSRAELEEQDARLLYESDEEYERVGIVKHSEIRRTGLGTVETRWLRKDGLTIDIILSSSAINPNDFSRGLVFTAMDVTARKRTDEMLKKATEHLKHEHVALSEKNIALKQVLDHMEKERQGDRVRLVSGIEDALSPLVERIKRRAADDIVKDLESLEANLNAMLERDGNGFEQKLNELTPREREICDMIREGASSKEISERLILSVATVHKHREQIRKKLGLANINVELGVYLRR